MLVLPFSVAYGFVYLFIYFWLVLLKIECSILGKNCYKQALSNVVVRCGQREAFCSPLIKSQSSGELGPQNSEFY